MGESGPEVYEKKYSLKQVPDLIAHHEECPKCGRRITWFQYPTRRKGKRFDAYTGPIPRFAHCAHCEAEIWAKRGVFPRIVHDPDV